MNPNSKKNKNITGQKFGRLTAISCSFMSCDLSKWLCKCDCGAERNVNIYDLLDGKSKSCGCLAKEMAKFYKNSEKHGKYYSSEYGSWDNMIQRCKNKKHKAYKNYGGRNITVCDEWLNFENFYKDMGDKPFAGAQIDRIDNNAGYNKSNCKWSDRKSQNRNKRTNRIVTFNGESKCITEWAEQIGIKSNSLFFRLKNWTLERALTERPNI